MRKVAGCIGVFIIGVLLAGCMDVETVVKVKKDSSGTIEERVMMSKEAASQMKMMMSGMAESFSGEEGEEGVTAPKPFNLFDEEELKEKAADKGEGVTYVSGKALETETQEGYLAIYAFEDITKLKISSDANSPMGSEMGAMPGMAPGMSSTPEVKTNAKNLRFEFTKGDPATLRVLFPREEQDTSEKNVSDSGEVESEDNQMGQMAPQMMGMFKDMRFALRLEMEGKVVDSNASFQEGSTVTLFDMDFGKLMQDMDKFKEFTKKGPADLAAAKELMKSIDGIQIETEEEIYVKYQ